MITKTRFAVAAIAAAFISLQFASAASKALPAASLRGDLQPSATAFGKNFIAAGGQVGAVHVYPKSTSTWKTAYGALLDLNYNIYKDRKDTFGVDLYVPLNYTFLSFNGIDSNSLTFPFFARGYYRFSVSKDVTLTPYAAVGFGGIYSYNGGENGNNESRLDFYWGALAGVEVLFFKDFALTPNVKFNKSEGGTNGVGIKNPWEIAAGLDFTWKFTSNMALVVGYEHWFEQGNEYSSEVGSAKIRFDF